MDRKIKGSGILNWATLLMAIGTIGIAIFTLLQYFVVIGTLNVYKEQLRMMQKPDVMLSITNDPIKGLSIKFDRLEEESEKWTLPYFVINNGDKAAFNLRYGHLIDNNESFELPNIEKMQSLHKDLMIISGLCVTCGSDELYRQQVIDKKELGIDYFRHLCVSFSDELGNKYAYVATWKLDYVVGQKLEWDLISYRKVNIN